MTDCVDLISKELVKLIWDIGNLFESWEVVDINNIVLLSTSSLDNIISENIDIEVFSDFLRQLRNQLLIQCGDWIF